MLENAVREMVEHPHLAMDIAKAALDALDKSSCHPLDTPIQARQRGEREAVAGVQINSHYDGTTH